MLWRLAAESARRNRRSWSGQWSRASRRTFQKSGKSWSTRRTPTRSTGKLSTSSFTVLIRFIWRGYNAIFRQLYCVKCTCPSQTFGVCSKSFAANIKSTTSPTHTKLTSLNIHGEVWQAIRHQMSIEDKSCDIMVLPKTGSKQINRRYDIIYKKSVASLLSRE